MGDDVRTTDDRGTISGALVRDFIANALGHDAVADEVAELLYVHLREGDSAPRALMRPLRNAIVEIINLATDEDWQVVCEELVANARDAVELAGKESLPDGKAESWREQVERLLADRVTFGLSDEDWNAFNEALDRPARPIRAVVELLRRKRPE